MVPDYADTTTFVLNGGPNGVLTAAFGIATVDIDEELCWVSASGGGGRRGF